MELLCDLVIRAHHAHRLRRFDSHLHKEVRQVRRKAVFRFFRIANLVVPDLKLDRTPRSTLVIKSHFEWLHHVSLRHCCGLRRSLLNQPSREACPSGGEGILKVASELSEWLDSSHIKVLGESRLAPVAQRHCTAPFDRSLRQHLADHDKRHRNTATQCETIIAFEVPNALLQRAHVLWNVAVVHGCSPSLTRYHSVVVRSPSSRASLAARSRRSVSMRPRHSRIASATGCEIRP